jgi:hypothetical protein
VVKSWNSTGNFSVVIQNVSTGATVFNKTFNMATANTPFTVNINTTFPTGSYTITLNAPSFNWYGATWGGATNAGQISLPTFGASGEYQLANLIYNYVNYTYTPVCANEVGVNRLCSLPIELINFDGQFESGKVNLSWSTSSEINNSYFAVQRSQDGVNFTTIKTVKGAGNSSAISDYSTIDPSPSPKSNYYRLVQYDFDGKSTTSNVILINGPAHSTEFKVSPNPSSQSFSVNFPNNIGGTLSVFNTVGQEISVQDISSEIGQITIGNELQKGAYILKFSNESGISSTLIIKE